LRGKEKISKTGLISEVWKSREDPSSTVVDDDGDNGRTGTAGKKKRGAIVKGRKITDDSNGWGSGRVSESTRGSDGAIYATCASVIADGGGSHRHRLLRRGFDREVMKRAICETDWEAVGEV
jgi:hypothetical protein